MKRIHAKLVALAALALFSPSVGAQAKRAAAAEDTLFRQIAASDSAFFYAYNNCEMSKMRAYFTTDVEFYHDQTGLSHLPKLMSDLQKNICGKVHRDPVPGLSRSTPSKVMARSRPGSIDSATPGSTGPARKELAVSRSSSPSGAGRMVSGACRG